MRGSIEVESAATATIIRFVRPEIRNPLSVAVIEEIGGLLDGIGDSCPIVFTGNDDVFASGADLREIAGVTEETAADFARRGQALMNRIASMPQETVAAINGFCFGGALDLALSCDRRIAAPNATFAHPGAGLGIITGWGGTQRLPRLIGTANALELFFTAAPIGAERALRIGLVDDITEDPLARALQTL